ncbi:hypothetical protein TYRP_005022 [Tyrophagus putrescentiae]|nr:hypothetical protein TYRP_005022 [Tyrophagus putrescentiae]
MWELLKAKSALTGVENVAATAEAKYSPAVPGSRRHSAHCHAKAINIQLRYAQANGRTTR